MAEEPISADEIARRARELSAHAGRRSTETSPPPRPLPRGLRSPADLFRAQGVQDPRKLPIALVLAGGGARGAYQAGVARYLAEERVPVHAISGASIGALNGAILASAPTLAGGADSLLAAWTHVARQAGRPARRAASPDDPAGGALGDVPIVEETTLEQLVNLWPRLRGPIFQRGFLDDLLTRYVDLGALALGRLPLFVSVFPSVEPSRGSLEALLPIKRRDGPDHGMLHPRFGWVFDVVRGVVQGRAAARWVLVSSLAREQIPDTLLASAAVPVVLPPRRVGGEVLRDGGIGDNLPIGALYQLARVRRVVVVHLKPYPLFNPDEFPGLDLIEIMPSRPLDPGGPLSWGSGLLDFSSDRVHALYELGYADAREQLGRVWWHEAVELLAAFTEEFRRDAVAELDEPR
ncbi:patatin-like phospholipase family protein [Frankia sp. CiP3]|uniref:patatin-like phospholipase family protein n=1 Tax=Frankia sp. CiP3 TaxID=2880971 RepID=UPI001EF40AFB|nr:patatin-like phospholipase family protein [Frankia sp. CiP3]